MEKKFVI